MLLAQVDATTAEGLAKNPLPWLFVISLSVVAFLFRQWQAEQKAHLETVKTNAKEQREIVEKIVPITAKLIDAVESLDRITERLAGGK